MDRELRLNIIRISALLMSVACIFLGTGLQGTLLAVRARFEHMNVEVIGLFMSAFYGGYVLGSLFVPRLIARVGHIRTFAALASIASSLALAHVIFISPVSWIVFRAIHGACFAGTVLVIESWLNGTTTQQLRGRILSIYGIVNLASLSLSQIMLNLADPGGFVLFCVVSILCSLALVPITLSKGRTPGAVTATHINFQKLYAISPIGLIGIFTAGFSTSAFYSMGPTYSHIVGLSSAKISFFMSVALIGAMALQWPLGWLSDIVDRRLVIVSASLGAASISLLMLLIADKKLIVLLLFSFIFGSLTFPLYSICVAHVNDQITEKELVAVASGLILTYGVGSIIGPILASIFMGRIGPGGLFLFTGIGALLFTVFGCYQMHKKNGCLKELKEALASLIMGKK